MPTPVNFAILGTGSRGAGYARWLADHPDLARVVAVADPDKTARDTVGDVCGVAPDQRFTSWDQWLESGPTGVDAVIVATQDNLHKEPCVAMLAAGFHVLVEKPLATTAQDCIDIVEAAEASGKMLGVCHVLRYTPYTRAIQELVRSGAIGDLVSIQHLEAVGWWHHAHSFVRGNWRSEAESAPMLLAKSCHDYDWMVTIVGAQVSAASSFGGTRHFQPGDKPAEAADRCLDCSLQDTCPYSAKTIYLEPSKGMDTPDVWPFNVLTHDHTPEGIRRALETGSYGECVYNGHNDVVDHQVVALEFANGVTGTFTMTAFTPMMDRHTRLFGTHGYVEGDGTDIKVYSFVTREWTTMESIRPTEGADAASGHGGGDAGLIHDFVRAVAADDPSLLATTAQDALASHLAVFETERARHGRSVVELPARV